MAYPIQDCLLFPRRLPCPAPQLDVAEALSLTMSPPDPARYPCLGLARAAAAAGGTAPAIFNAANEVAVEAFVAGRLPFTGIAELVQRTLAAQTAEEPGSLEAVLAADAAARLTASRLAPGLAR
jgi:1-deoxy-D-xylulose-5-phosphate reductoisomerase